MLQRRFRTEPLDVTLHARRILNKHMDIDFKGNPN